MGNGFPLRTTTKERQGSEVSFVEVRLRQGASKVSAYILPCRVWLRVERETDSPNLGVAVSVGAIVVVTEVCWLTVVAVLVGVVAVLDARTGLGSLDDNEVVLSDETLVAR
jgi:hypothetical protein